MCSECVCGAPRPHTPHTRRPRSAPPQSATASPRLEPYLKIASPYEALFFVRVESAGCSSEIAAAWATHAPLAPSQWRANSASAQTENRSLARSGRRSRRRRSRTGAPRLRRCRQRRRSASASPTCAIGDPLQRVVLRKRRLAAQRRSPVPKRGGPQAAHGRGRDSRQLGGAAAPPFRRGQNAAAGWASCRGPAAQGRALRCAWRARVVTRRAS